MHVLFLCPHGAAKSVLAAAILCDRAAARCDLGVTASSAGTDPDAFVNPIAVEALLARGLSYDGVPRLVEPTDIERADVVVSFGCHIADLPAQPSRFVDWADLPDVSDDVEGFCRAVTDRVGSPLSDTAGYGTSGPIQLRWR
jgi:protein-tyrosine-phosphatase